MSEANKALFRRFIDEVWNRRNLAVIDELFASNYTRHASSSDPDFGTGPDSVRKLVQFYSQAFPDTRFTIDDLVAEGDKVVLRWTARGTHQGALEGAPPSNKRVTVTGTTTARVANGKIAEEWENWDALGMMEQIGILPRRVGRAGA